MTKIAIDVVLLPPENIMDKAIEINSQFADDPIKLNKENCLPHISLCMGVLEEENLTKIKAIIEEISKQFSKLFLTIDKISAEHVCFEVKNNETLQKLHEGIMTKLSPYLSYDATTDMCFSPPFVVEKTLTWINNYRNTSFEEFYPHITLGISKLENRDLNIDFVASKIVVCQLGNYCTCRKVIISSDLS